jgi:hypothetical protein
MWRFYPSVRFKLQPGKDQQILIEFVPKERGVHYRVKLKKAIPVTGREGPP